jgi:hypothetical protein
MSVSQKYANILLLGIIISFLTVSMAHAQQALSIDERIAIVEKKIEGGVMRGDLTRNEYSRLKPRLAVVKYKRAQMDKPNATEQTYKDLEHYLYGLEMDTDRMINSLKRR